MSEYIQLDLFDDSFQNGNSSTKKKRQKKIKPEDEPLEKKIERALWLLRTAAADSDQPIEVSYSGGKDSDVILELARMAGIKYRAIYKNTTIDPPGTIKHCMENGVEVMRRKSFAQVIQAKGFPNFLRRFCCAELKEYKVLDRSVQGIRRSESTKRAKRYKEPTVCRLYGSKKQHVEVFLPILHWTDADVAEFIRQRGIKCHPLYYDEDGTFHVERRLGCIGCPLAYKKHRIEEFKQYPGMVRLYVKAAQKFLDEHPESHTLVNFKDAAEWFTFTLYCDTMEEWRDKFGPTLFDNGIDCHKHLSELFGIDL